VFFHKITLPKESRKVVFVALKHKNTIVKDPQKQDKIRLSRQNLKLWFIHGIWGLPGMVGAMVLRVKSRVRPAKRLTDDKRPEMLLLSK